MEQTNRSFSAKNLNWNKKRILPIVFALAALLLMLTNWLTLSGNAQHYVFEFRSEMLSVLDETEDLLNQMGLYIDMRPLYEIVTTLSRESLNPFELCSVAHNGISVLNDIKPYSGIISQFSGKRITSTINTLLTMCYIYIVLLLLSIATGVVTLLARIMGKKTEINRLFFISQLLLLAYLIFFCYLGNGNDGTLPIRPTITAAISVILSCLTGPRNLKDGSPKAENRPIYFDAPSEDETKTA